MSGYREDFSLLCSEVQGTIMDPDHTSIHVPEKFEWIESGILKV